KPQRAVERAPIVDPVLVQRARVGDATVAALRRYVPGHFAGNLSLFLPSKEWLGWGHMWRKWQSVAQCTEEYLGPDGCDGATMLREPYAPIFAELFTQHCARAVKTQEDSDIAMRSSRAQVV